MGSASPLLLKRPPIHEKKTPKRIEEERFETKKAPTLCRPQDFHPGTRRLLHEAYGHVKPGMLTPLMSAFRAGKTTCLDVLAQRKHIGVASSNILINGESLDN